jgi:hypothetical protein
MTGLGFGFTQLSTFGIFAGMFFFGGFFIERDFPKLNAENAFMAIFCIMFSAL